VRWSAWGPAIGLIIAPFVYWVAFRAESMAVASVLLIIGGSLLMLFYGPTVAMVSNMLEPRMRATGAALFGVTYTLVGSGMGPTFIGFMSDRFATSAFTGADYRAACLGISRTSPGNGQLVVACRDAAALGVGHALSLVVCVFFVAAGCYLLASRTLGRDLFSPRPTKPAPQDHKP